MTRLESVKLAALAMQRYSWEQGVLSQAFLEAGDEETAILLAIESAHRQSPDGRCAQLGGGTACTDPCSMGEALIFACEKTNDPALIEAKDKLMVWAAEKAPRNEKGVVYHFDDRKEFWVDSFYMLPPVLARAGYFENAMCQLDGYWETLFVPEKGLLAHRWDDGAKRFIRKDVWSVGNGWAAAGMARVIAMLPETFSAERERLINRTKLLLESAMKFQREDGLFHDVLDNPETFMDVNCSQMFAYTMYRGIQGGWLSEDWLPKAERIREACNAHVDRYGLVQNVCGAPHFDAPGTATEGQAFYILMEAARTDLLKQ